jgi:hypothetical protein
MRSDSLIGYRLEIRITYSNVALKRVHGELFPSRQLKKKAYIPYPKGIGVLRHSYKNLMIFITPDRARGSRRKLGIKKADWENSQPAF